MKLNEDKEIFCHLNEPHILQKLINYKFLPKLISSFQDFENLYLVTNLNEGSNLYHYKDENMTEEQLKFISACIIQSFIYLRKNNIIHRDIRMHNLIMDQDNYLSNCLRYIINNYYNETLLNIFDKSLNLNLKRYIKIMKNNLSFNEFNNLMSK